MYFKSLRLQQEFKDPELVNARLRGCLYDLDDRCKSELGKELCIVCLLRTPTENKKVKGNSKSFHLRRPCGAADIRTTTTKWFTKTEAKQIKHWFDTEHAYGEHDRCIIEGNHIHIQMEYSENKDPEEIYVIGVQ